jgi:AbrB family looped-hinge helix DNA binding protein
LPHGTLNAAEKTAAQSRETISSLTPEIESMTRGSSLGKQAIWRRSTERIEILYDRVVKQIVRIDKSGRVLIPKPIREKLGFKPDQSLEIQIIDGKMILRPIVKGEIELSDGVYVWAGYDPIKVTIKQLIDDAREDRAEMLA